MKRERRTACRVSIELDHDRAPLPLALELQSSTPDEKPILIEERAALAELVFGVVVAFILGLNMGRDDDAAQSIERQFAAGPPICALARNDPATRARHNETRPSCSFTGFLTTNPTPSKPMPNPALTETRHRLSPSRAVTARWAQAW
jgi:hypothetical protein